MAFDSSIRRLTKSVTSVLLLLSISLSTFADSPVTKTDSAVLHLTNGDHVTGTMINSTVDRSIGWQSPAFTSPFHFALGGIASIHFPVPAKLPQPEGDYCFELMGGDMVFGSLIALDDKKVVVHSPEVGRLNIDRNIIQRMYRWGGGSDQLFVGPNGLNGWQVGGEENSWREDAGQLVTDQAGAILRRDFGIPNQARFEFELSWKGQPDFKFAIGVGDDPKTALRAYQFEVWENEIVIQRETEKEADVANLQKVLGKSGRLHLQAFLDQTEGRMLVFTSNGDPLADLTVTSTKPQVFGGVQLTNTSGDVRLERLQIGRWNGDLPRVAEVNKSRIHGVDGAITYGSLTSYDSEKHEFVIGEGADAQRIPEERVHDVFLSQPSDPVPRSLRAVFQSGMKFSGDLIRIEANNAILKSPGIEEALVLPLTSLQSFVILAPTSDPPELQQRRGRLEATETRLHGCLVDGHEGDARCLVWQPVRSSTSSPLQYGISARIVYKEPVPPPPPTPPQQQAMQAQVRVRRGGGIVGQIQDMFTDGQPANPGSKTNQKPQPVLHLRTGDKLPCTVTSMDERGVTFESKVSDATFIPHDQIQALELISDAPPTKIQSLKKQRLLTLPRMQRDNPPTHLVRSVDGDYLRGRIVSMDDAQMQIELRLEAKIVKRDRIVRILWLHPEPVNPESTSEIKETSVDANRVQALPSDGNRITFVPNQVAGSILSGRSEFLGACRVDLQQVDQLIIGAAIEQAAAGLPFHDWKLKQAADPLAPKEGSEGSGEGNEGLESALVGKPAPEISLNFLDGKKFQLADHKQKVIILDFWASWCGPCLQVMPQIDKVAHEFADQGVELYAVNLEESPDKIKAALERLKLETNVILDRDGRVAERYGATAIPQTVIIDRDGKVARLFVGGGARFDDQLRGALKSVLAGEAAKSE